MQKLLVIMAIFTTLLCAQSGPAQSLDLPFPERLTLSAIPSKTITSDQIRSRLRVLVNSLPFLLEQRLRSQNGLVKQEVNETLEALETCVERLGKSVTNNRDKELFAKLLAGLQKLKSRVQADLKAVEQYRVAEEVFARRISLLLTWLGGVATQWDSAQGPDKERLPTDYRTLMDNLRVDLLKAASFTSMASCGATCGTDSRNRANVEWDAALSQVEALREASDSSSPSGDTVELIEAYVERVKKMADELMLRTDELNQARELMLTQVESIQALLKPVPKEPESKPDSAKKQDQPSE